MAHLLHLSVSNRGDRSISREVGRLLVARLQAANPKRRVIARDLAALPPPHPEPDFVAANLMPEAERGKMLEKWTASMHEVNPKTGTMRGRAVFDNKDGVFTPGLYVRLKLVGSANYMASLINDSAVGTDLGILTQGVQGLADRFGVRKPLPL